MSGNPVLLVHYGVAFLVFLSALAAIFVPVFRRIVLYVLVVQILVGFGLWFGAHYPAPVPAHWILAILVGGLYAASSAAEKRGRSALPYTIGGAIVIAFVFSLGMHQVMHPAT